ncbi:hypothetical protein Tco_1009092 [Tanacetum coccineum]
MRRLLRRSDGENEGWYAVTSRTHMKPMRVAGVDSFLHNFGEEWEEQTNPQGSVRTTSDVDLEEFCEKHYEKLLPIMADKYEYEKRKKEKPEDLTLAMPERRELGRMNQRILSPGQYRQKDKDALAARATILESSLG